MTSPSLDYASSASARPRRPLRWRRVWIVAALLSSALALWWTVPVRRDEDVIDAVTGSMARKTVWLGCLTSGPKVDVSPLERRLKSAGVTWTPDPRFLHNTHRTASGHARGFECGMAPPMYTLRPLLKDFVGASSDAELAAFVRVLQSGTDAERRAAVDAAADKALR